MLKLPVRENSTFCMLGWVRATITLRRDGRAVRGLPRAERTAQLSLRSVMRARWGSPLQADCSRFLGFELNRVWVSFVVVQLLSSRAEMRGTPFQEKRLTDQCPEEPLFAEISARGIWFRAGRANGS